MDHSVSNKNSLHIGQIWYASYRNDYRFSPLMQSRVKTYDKSLQTLRKLHYRYSMHPLIHLRMTSWQRNDFHIITVYPKKYAHGFVVLCFVVVMQSFIMNSHEVFIHIHQGCFAGTGAIVRLPQCQWSRPDGYGKISQCNTTTKRNKAKTVCIFLGIYCKYLW